MEPVPTPSTQSQMEMAFGRAQTKTVDRDSLQALPPPPNHEVLPMPDPRSADLIATRGISEAVRLRRINRIQRTADTLSRRGNVTAQVGEILADPTKAWGGYESYDNPDRPITRVDHRVTRRQELLHERLTQNATKANRIRMANGVPGSTAAGGHGKESPFPAAVTTEHLSRHEQTHVRKSNRTAAKLDKRVNRDKRKLAKISGDRGVKAAVRRTRSEFNERHAAKLRAKLVAKQRKRSATTTTT